ncbi:pseudouridine synthase [Rhizobium calliandrae]|uniref:Pseudouridine synthase n=1 Tax=Rhizobium calliandrae TaxID=1312182 RepID=A0ABT7KI81_9HYPH|nr:pseudouridine synthase [Rhizobium calliandrae]MDL2408344.1 pseudouridine synthase [Rhizobium calliandrae]
MTMNDKPKRPGSKPFTRDVKTKPAKTGDDAKPMKAASAKATAETEGGDGKAERISKVMARAGVASRRDIERMIMDGRVKLNGVLLDTPVVNVTLTDKIEVDGVPIRGIERTRLWLYHKPAGLVTTNADPEGRPTVFDNLPEELPRVMSIGRLDINTEGLLLLTNDGGLARVLELPTTGWLRRYRVRAHGEIDQEALDKLKEGIAVDGVLYGSIEATLDRTQGSNVWITMGLREGKNREIKNVLGALGLEVNRLIRISYGPFQLGELAEGRVLEVRGRTLRDQLGPRLVEDAKANFDAPLYNASAGALEDEADAKPARAAKEERLRRERPEDKRERALSRLDTKREDRREGGRRADDRRESSRHGEDDRAKRQPLGPRRSANVWMAPGARPLGEKAALKAAKNARTAAKRGETERPQRGGFDRPDEGPRVRVNRVDEADGEWIRSSEVAPRKRGDDEGFERKRSRGDRPQSDRPARGDRPFGDRPRGERGSRTEGGDRPRTKSFQGEARSERPRGDRPFGDRPSRGDKPFGSKPRGDRPYGDRRPRPEGDDPARSFHGEQRSERPRSDRPQGERSYGERPAGKPFGKKPGGKSFGGKPGGKPGGARGFSGKPGGAGRPSAGPGRGGANRGGSGRGGPKGGRG